MKTAGRGIFEGLVHPFDLTIGLGVEEAGQAMLGTMLTADHIESMGFISLGAAAFGELHAIVGQHRMHPVRQLLHDIFKKGGGLIAIGLPIKPGMEKFRGTINAHE
ncbi:hypothetical protein C8D96_1807 [Kushneria marisflavi]|nr:hypothetical protein C8D96_1807 [Kushneria marisflavi]